MLPDAAELVVSTGALEEATPLAEVPVDGAVDVSDGVTDGEGDSDVLGDVLGEDDGECDVLGLGEAGFVVVDLDGDGVCDPLVPLGLSEGVLLDGGVGSSDVP